MKKDVVINAVQEIMKNKSDKEFIETQIKLIENEVKNELGGIATVSAIRFDLIYKGYTDNVDSIALRNEDVRSVNNFFKKHGIDVIYS